MECEFQEVSCPRGTIAGLSSNPFPESNVMRAIVVCAACKAQNHRIATHLAKSMTDSGVPTDVFDVSRDDVCELDIELYQAVVFGSSLRLGEHDPRVAWCMRHHQIWLTTIPTAFYSVSQRLRADDAKGLREVEWSDGEFLCQQQFEPSIRACLTSTVSESKLDWLKKPFRRKESYGSQGRWEAGREHECADWKLVESFAISFADLVQRFWDSTRVRSPCLDFFDRDFRRSHYEDFAKYSHD